MLQDKLKATEFAANRPQGIDANNSYNYIYPYTTENIGGYIPEVKGKSILSVIGSGDHYLNFASEGAKTIDSFDINRFSIFYLKLKKAAALALSLEEFRVFFEKDTSPYYDRVKEHLDEEARDFWDYYVLYFMNRSGIQDTNVFFTRVLEGQYQRFNRYMTPCRYSYLQKQLPSHEEEKYYHSDVLDLPDILSKKYDYIFLSNIHSYQHDPKKFEKTVQKLYQKSLKSNGAIYYAYCYQSEEDEITIPNIQKECVSSIEVSPAFPYQTGTDKVLVLSK